MKFPLSFCAILAFCPLLLIEAKNTIKVAHLQPNNPSIVNEVGQKSIKKIKNAFSATSAEHVLPGHEGPRHPAPRN